MLLARRKGEGTFKSVRQGDESHVQLLADPCDATGYDSPRHNGSMAGMEGYFQWQAIITDQRAARLADGCFNQTCLAHAWLFALATRACQPEATGDCAL